MGRRYDYHYAGYVDDDGMIDDNAEAFIVDYVASNLLLFLNKLKENTTRIYGPYGGLPEAVKKSFNAIEENANNLSMSIGK